MSFVGKLPGRNFLDGKLIIKFPSEKCHGKNYPGGEMSERHLSGYRKCHGENYQSGTCPVAIVREGHARWLLSGKDMPGWLLSSPAPQDACLRDRASITTTEFLLIVFLLTEVPACCKSFCISVGL